MKDFLNFPEFKEFIKRNNFKPSYCDAKIDETIINQNKIVLDNDEMTIEITEMYDNVSGVATSATVIIKDYKKKGIKPKGELLKREIKELYGDFYGRIQKK